TPTFPILCTLALHNIRAYHLDFGVLVAFLRSAPLLEHLGMHLIHVLRPLPPGSMPTVLLPQLTRFDVAFGNAPTVTLLLPYLSAPAITSLAITLDSTSDVRSAIECATAFKGGPALPPLPLFNLYSAFTCLENNSVLRHLRILFLGCEDMPLIKEFAQIHGAKNGSFTSPPFFKLRINKLFDMEVISWLSHHLELFERYDVDSKY
ncbi:hypothetical protein C8J57DRAFT_1332273, partial [Mycena rebaudengoi]